MRRFPTASALLVAVAALATAGPLSRYAHPEFLTDARALQGAIGKADVVILDTRGSNDYAAGHIPGAVNLQPARLDYAPKLANGAEVRSEVLAADGVLPVLRTAGINARSHVVIYDAGGGVFATRLWWVLDYYGHKDIAILDGGFGMWQRSGGAVSTAAVSVAPGDFVPRADPAKIADYDYVKARLGTDATAVCDALSAKSYSEGAIERTLNLPSSQQFDGESRLMKSADDLSTAFLEVTLSPEKEIIFYCGNGYAASVDYFVARVLGYTNVRLYDGSITDWTARGDKLVPAGKS
jgi:thiosulfate/3-mercaptopyruvate sulfurtransferase